MKKALLAAGYILVLLLAYVAFQGLFTFIAMFVAILWAVFKGQMSADVLEHLDNLDSALSLSANDAYIQAMAVGLFLSTISMLVFLHLIKGYRIKLEIFRSISSNSLFLSTMLVFSSMLALNIFVQWFQLEDMLATEFEGLTRNPLGIITISFLAPLLEEVLFRGAMQGYLMRRYKPWVAILAAALVFGVFHWNPVQVLYATLLGAVFGWIYYRTGSLLSVIVGHVLNNSLATAMMLAFGNEEIRPLPEGMISPVAETASEVVTFLFFAFLSLYFAVRLHRALPPVSLPWQDKGGDIK